MKITNFLLQYTIIILIIYYFSPHCSPKRIIPSEYFENLDKLEEALKETFQKGENKKSIVYADEITTKMIVAAAGIGKEGEDGLVFLKPTNITNIQCAYLLKIDSLWGKYSSEKYGFNVQINIYMKDKNNFEQNLGLNNTVEKSTEIVGGFPKSIYKINPRRVMRGISEKLTICYGEINNEK